MDNKEAGYVLNELLEKVKASPNKTNILAKEKQALELAIDALNENESLARTVNEASELLRKKRPRGEWIYEGVCSICGERCDYHLSGTIWIDRPANYCPNCGAIMKRGDT